MVYAGRFIYILMDIGEGIIHWYECNKRDLPWRKTIDPYKIWLSEIILQQTRVLQGLPYYNRFISLFPTVLDLANSPIDTVLKAWQGLGYYSRAHNLHRTSKIIAFENFGVFPQRFEELRKLPGIGDYTAAAIASFSYNESVPVLDGNVYRVLSRILGIYTLPDSQKEKAVYFHAARTIMGNHNPAQINQGMMEFGALFCKPQNPLCSDCPFHRVCYAYRNEKVMELPVKKIRNPLKIRFFNYLVFRSDSGYYIQKRREKDIWPGLFEFPLIESDKGLNVDELENILEFNGMRIRTKENLNPEKMEFSQVLSHQRIQFSFWIFPFGTKPQEEKQDGFWVEEENLNKYAFPKVTHKLVKEIQGYKTHEE